MKLEITSVLDLLHRSSFSTLATQSLQMPGYPYATVIPNVLDECHRSLLLISALAEHTIDASLVRQMGLMIADRQAGPFELGIRSIAVDLAGS